MTTTTTHAHDYAKKDEEKQDEAVHIENANSSPSGASLDLEKTRTLEPIDVTNRGAFLGDDSDGKVEWGVRQIFAAIFLAGLYTGR